MTHYQKQFQCSVCKREIVIDIQNIGISHDTIMAVTCLECAKKVGGNIMGEKVEELKFDIPTNEPDITAQMPSDNRTNKTV